VALGPGPQRPGPRAYVGRLYDFDMQPPVATRTLRTTLPARYYTDPAYFRREAEHFFFTKWICAGRADQIPNRGDYFLRDVLGESIIVVRNDRGDLSAMFNVCRHRGTRICETACGTFPGSIQCPYHAWTYDLHGRLIGAPHMDAIQGFDKRDFPLKAVGCEVWDGHIFINLSTEMGRPKGRSLRETRGGAGVGADLQVGPTTLRDQVGPLMERFRPWRMEELRLVHRTVYDVRANWKLIVQNYNECLHCPVLHPLLNQMHHYLGASNAPSEATYCGGTMGFKEGIETLSLDGKRRRNYLPGLGPEEKALVSYYSIYPNMLLTLHPDYMVTVTLWPKAPDRTELICEWHFHADEIARSDFEFRDAIDFWDLTNREDWHISELSQAGISSRAYQPGPYSGREQLLWDFDQVVLREMGEQSQHGGS
jgi:Rieske 2Fe-2S family protein